ncbi:MAG: lipid A export permease/ATP-binding protein MsbA [Nitrosomonadales bacterium]|jgi:subfamily B ATP-binding cassette protein MsbA|nr:lipid A export permease/ATP-binding protein MsbA [Nitrosomonadales bacterium]MBT4759267.1 lipid A export permease/ATP-binding protein MsbA [Nitrosomonadales bacterium]
MSKEIATKETLKDYKKAYIRLFKYTLTYKLILIFSILATVIMALADTSFLALIKKVTDEGFIGNSDNQVSLIPFILIFIVLIRASARFISSYSMRWVARKTVQSLRYDIFDNLMKLPINYFDSNATGVLVSKITYETEQLQYIITKLTIDTLRDCITIIAVVSYMFYLNWLLAIFVIIILPIVGYFIKKIIPKLRNAAKESQGLMGDITRIAEEAISGQRIVKIFGASKYERERFSKVISRNRQMGTKLARLSATNGLIIEIILGLLLAGVLHYSLTNLSSGEFIAFIGAVVLIMTPIKRLTALNEQMQIGYAAAVSVFSVMDEKKEKDLGGINLKKVIGKLEFTNVSFSYPKGNKPVLTNININIKAGEKIALVGKSGGGKTTLLNLIPKFYDVSSGFVKLDDVDINTISLNSLRKSLALVSQDTILFNDTIYNNIAYGNLDSVSIEKVKKAAKAANALEFINKLPNGFNHIIGDRGVRLSGGQKQRIAIARAILKNAPILLLDEATSALDSESERLVQAALDNLMANKTSIVIAHRLSTIRNADKIIVMDQGRIVGEGKHNTLIKNNKFYLKIYKKGFA